MSMYGLIWDIYLNIQKSAEKGISRDVEYVSEKGYRLYKEQNRLRLLS